MTDTTKATASISPMGDAARQQIAATRLAKSSTQPSKTIDPRPVLKTENPGATTPITTAIAAPTAAKPAAGALVDVQERVDSVKSDGGELVLDFKGKPESSRVRNRKRKLEAASIEAPRVSRRLQLVRRSIRYEQDNQQIFT